jgi:hypothetical protein
VTYHLHTEADPDLPVVVGRHFAGATISGAVGLWKGATESAAVIEVATDDHAAVVALADDIKRTNHQAAVLVESYVTVPEVI